MPSKREGLETRLLDWDAAVRLAHPHLMRIFDFGRAEVGGLDLLYVVTEFAEESLAEALPERPLSAGEARKMLPPILDALWFLHAQGLVHGHIKPSNIMVVGDRVKLPVEDVHHAGRLHMPGEQTQIYDAPELVSDPVSPAADIWALGVTLVEALTQKPPRWDRSAKNNLVLPPEISQPFADIARASLRHDPSQRASIPEIRALLNSETSLREPANEFDPVAPAALAEQAQDDDDSPQSGRRMVIVGAGFLALLVVIALLVIRSHKFGPPSAPVPPSPSPTVAQPPAPAVSPAPPSPFPASPSELSGGTAKGAVAKRVMPDVLASANRTIHGKVRVRVRLNVDGNGAVSGSGFDVHGSSRYFADKALEAARKWTFKPALQNGSPAPSVWILQFDFRRNGPEVTAREVSP